MSITVPAEVAVVLRERAAGCGLTVPQLISRDYLNTTFVLKERATGKPPPRKKQDPRGRMTQVERMLDDSLREEDPPRTLREFRDDIAPKRHKPCSCDFNPSKDRGHSFLCDSHQLEG